MFLFVSCKQYDINDENSIDKTELMKIHNRIKQKINKNDIEIALKNINTKDDLTPEQQNAYIYSLTMQSSLINTELKKCY